MPGDTESYVHRIGRTGRAGREGKAVLFVTPRQQRMMRDIENYTRQKIEPLKLPTQADVAARRVTSLKEKIITTLTEQNLELYLALVEDLVEENGCDMSEIAAAAVFLSVGDKLLEVKVEPEPQKFSFSEEGMVRLFIDVGRFHDVSPAHIVGAIANEANVPGKAIGAIDVNDRFSLVDIPAQYVGQILELMSSSRIGKQTANIRLASTVDVEAEAKKNASQRREREFGGEREFGRGRDRKSKKPFKSGGFSGNFEGKGKKKPFITFPKRKKKKKS